MDEDEGEVEAAADETAEEERPQKEKRASRTSKGSKTSRGSKKSFSSNQQQLFLVEFLVDTVCIDPCAVDEEVLEGQTCLSLTFLNFPPMEICEKDFDENKPSSKNKVRFNCGKSLMFALNENQCEKPPPLAIEITVLKKLGCEENPIRVEIGVIKVCISELFRQIVEVAMFKPEKLPASKAIKDCFMLIGPGKRTMGEVSVYIRLSCLGQNVVTEFQCGPDMKTSPVLFKSREGRKIYEFSGKNGDEAEGGEAGNGKQGCGCIAPQQPPGQGQGDCCEKDPPLCATYTNGNRVILDVPAKGEKRGGDCVPEKSKRKQKPPSGEAEANPDKNVFVLRVGDKGQIPDRGKMILEFKTPKQKILPKVIPPYHEEVAVQTDAGKKGKGKGKKGKK